MPQLSAEDKGKIIGMHASGMSNGRPQSKAELFRVLQDGLNALDRDLLHASKSSSCP